MQRYLRPGLAAALFWLLAACAVIAPEIREEAEVDVPFPQLRKDVARYVGRTVILGGYVLEVRNQPRRSELVVLQSPLGSGEEPQARTRSQGRFLLVQDGFLDPAVYAKDTKITVAGRVIGQTMEKIDGETYGYPTLEARQIHIWPPREEWRTPYDPYYPYAYPYGYPYPYGLRHRYHRDPYWW
jgi:outer membrane lipoprotein